MALKSVFTVLVLLFIVNGLVAQTPGFIYQPSSSSFGRSVLDPNGDGFTSPASTGFSVTDYGSGSELQMVALPALMVEPTADLLTGASGKSLDICTFTTDGITWALGESVYMLVSQVSGVDYLVVRFRQGSNSSATKGYSLLIDTDGDITNHYSDDNPGFEREVVLETGNRVAIYAHSASGSTRTHEYDVDVYQQRSFALSDNNGDQDVFYDFFVPLADVDASSMIRLVAVTITSAQSGIGGTISDFNGVNDGTYGNNRDAIIQGLITSFPSVYFADLNSSYTFPEVLTSIPTVNGPIYTSNTTITGSSQEADGTTITVYVDGVLLGTTTVSSHSWTLTGVSGLTVGEEITATAEAADKAVSEVSAGRTVFDVPDCYNEPPVITGKNGGQKSLTGTGDPGETIKFYYISVYPGTFAYFSGKDVVVAGDGTWTQSGLSPTTGDFKDLDFYVTSTDGSSCESDYSNITGFNGDLSTVTTAPTLNTTPISTSTTSVMVTNNFNDVNPAYLTLYINGTAYLTSATTVNYNSSYTFTIADGVLNVDDIVYARATGTGTGVGADDNDILSDISNTETVIGVQSNAPVITGTYINGGTSVSGTSTEPAGSTIYLYADGVLTGTTTVDIYGNWTVTGLTLSTAEVLTAKVQADGENISDASNSVTVGASLPTVPVVTGPISNDDTSVSGTSSEADGTTISVYVDGCLLGTTTVSSGAWTLGSIASGELYKDAEVTATATVSGIEGNASTAVIVTGVDHFTMTETDGSPLIDRQVGESFNVLIKAKDGSNVDYTAFTGTVTIGSATLLITGSGETTNFSSGELVVTLRFDEEGSNTDITAVCVSDPYALGSGTLDVYINVWNGDNSSTDFTDNNNWVNDRAPADNTDVIIPPGATYYPVITSSKNLRNITITSDATGTGALVGQEYLTISGTVIVEHYTTAGTGIWHPVSGPLANDSFLSMYYNGNPDVWAKEYVEASNTYNYVWPTNTPMGDMKGWMVHIDGDQPQTFDFTGDFRTGTVGTPDNMDISSGDGNHGYNFIGNPYPSPIDWDAASGWTRTNVDNGYWVWDQEHNDFATYIDGTSTLDATRYIGVGQGFFVQVNSAASSGTMIMSTDIQTTEAAPIFKSAVTQPAHHIKLRLSNDATYDECVVRIHDEATADYDPAFDMHKLINNTSTKPRIYSTDNLGMSINAIPPGTETVPLTVTGYQGEEMVIHAMDVTDFSSVWLHDSYLNTNTDLLQDDYTFNYHLSHPDRFSLSFLVTGVEQQQMSLTADIWGSDGLINIRLISTRPATLRISTLTGQVVGEAVLEPGLSQWPVSQDGIYMVQLTNSTESLVNKVMVK